MIDDDIFGRCLQDVDGTRGGVGLVEIQLRCPAIMAKAFNMGARTDPAFSDMAPQGFAIAGKPQVNGLGSGHATLF
jgi:hypothetical protein